MKLKIRQFTEIDALAPASLVSWRMSAPLRQPIPAFHGQDLEPLKRGMSEASLRLVESAVLAPRSELGLYTVDDGVFFVGHGMDGAILVDGDRPILQTAVFCYATTMGYLQDHEHALPEPIELDEVFIGFDGAWRNYFHWMCLALPKLAVAARHLDPSVIIAVPSYAEALAAGPISYSEATWRQSLAFSGVSPRVTELAAGVYRARKLHFFWTTPREPTGIMYCADYTRAFDMMAAQARSSSKPIDNVYLVRSNFVASRLEDGPAAIIARVLDRHGFEPVQMEGLDLAAQIAIFTGAKRVVGAHGAGLTNVLFHQGGLKLLELNSDLDGRSVFRPWFYVISALRKHSYAMLDTKMPDLAEEHVESALAALNG